ncbi:MAG: hypothetical protein HFE83_02450 [Lachnospiraceae bacterium]|jgi:hypothetical protein|nr:hypothetical protein [Lachnospiraceae bacterium]
MGTYTICTRLIATKKRSLLPEEWEAFKEEMSGKLDVFLLAGRLTNEQYTELLGMLSTKN